MIISGLLFLLFCSCSCSADYFREGLDLYKQKEFKEAIHSFKRSLEKDGDNPETHFYLALCYESLVENELAENEFRKTIELDKNNAEARYKLIYYLKGKGQFDEAIKQLRISAKIIEKQKGVKLNIEEEIKYLEQLKSIPHQAKD